MSGNSTAETALNAGGVEWLNVPQVAQIAQCWDGSVYRAIRERQLRAARIGGRKSLRIHRTWVREWLERCAEPVEAA